MPTQSTPRGTVPFAIGAVGHRVLPADVDDLEDAIQDAFAVLRQEHGALQLLVSLAEGADRLIADAALRLGIPYVAVLPVSPERFELDFQGAESIAEYRTLLAGADEIAQPTDDPADRVHGYVWVNQYIIERVALLLAVWDGQPANGPGGTADAIRAASEYGVPVLYIPTRPPHQPVPVLPLALDRT